MRRSCLLLPVLLSACAVGPDYMRPDFLLPDWWSGADKPEEAAPAQEAPAPWWAALHDPVLDGLMAQALAQNSDVKIAALRVVEARALLRSAEGALYPQLSAGANGSRGEQGIASLGIPAGVGGLPALSKPFNLYQATFDAAWEIDLFGGTRRNIEAQEASVEARALDERQARLSLTAEVARNYVAWRRLQHQAGLIAATAEAQAKLAEMARQRFDAGVASRFEASQAHSLALATAARLPPVEQAREAAGHRLSVLLGEPAGALNARLREPAPLPTLDNAPALAAPASVISRRPDLLAAEAELKAATALQGAATADLFPKVSLSALLGVQDSSLGDRTRIWSAGGGILVPLLNFGRLSGQVDAANARAAQALERYRGQVIAATAEVETALVAFLKAGEGEARLAQAADSAKETLELARLRYGHGLAPFTETLDAEQQSLSAQDALVAAQAARLEAFIALSKALGPTVP